MKIGCLLSVRNKAQRLPGKVLLDIAGQTLTHQLLQRLKKAQKVSQVILSTSVNPDDQNLVKLATEAGFAAFCGHEDDKLDRYYHTALKHDLDAVIVVDGDDLFCFPEGVDWIADVLCTGSYDCVALEGLPLGAASIGVTKAALKKVLTIKDTLNTEVWGGYFIGSGHFHSHVIHVDDPLLHQPHIRLTLDYLEDYDFLQAVVRHFKGRMDFSSRELMQLLVHERPELTAINQSAQKKYEQHIEKSTEVKFKEGVAV